MPPKTKAKSRKIASGTKSKPMSNKSFLKKAFKVLTSKKPKKTEAEKQASKRMKEAMKTPLQFPANDF